MPTNVQSGLLNSGLLSPLTYFVDDQTTGVNAIFRLVGVYLGGWLD